jgi:SpoIIAA-like
MIEKIAARGNIQAFRLSGKLTEEDYTNNLIPELERALENYKTIRLLLRVEHFEGWKPGGAWEEFKNWPLYSKIERTAVVADDSWAEWMSWMLKMFGIFTGLSISFYRINQMETAWDWIERS